MSDSSEIAIPIPAFCDDSSEDEQDEAQLPNASAGCASTHAWDQDLRPDAGSGSFARQKRPAVDVPEILGDARYRLERYNCEDLSVSKFRESIVFGKNPVIISGLAPYMRGGETDPRRFLSIDFLRSQVDPDMEVQVKLHGDMRLGHFFQHLYHELGDEGDRQPAKRAHYKHGQRIDNEAGLYMADISVALNFPWLYDTVVRIPKYFLHCFSHRTRNRSLENIAYLTPSLFVGNAGTFSSLHIDQYSSNFWMFMADGEKLWVTFHPDDVALLNPSRFDEEYQNWRWDESLLQRGEDDLPHALRRLEFVLRDGDLLFIPKKTPHEVYNLTDCCALSGNFFDQSNILDTLAQLKCKVGKLEETLALSAAGRTDTEEGAAQKVQLEKQMSKWREIYESLAEIDWPEVSDDVRHSFGCMEASQNDMVGLFPLHDEIKHSRKTFRKLA